MPQLFPDFPIGLQLYSVRHDCEKDLPMVLEAVAKMGYKGVESTELVYDGYKCPPDRILGGEEAGLNKGFGQMMDALEVGRVANRTDINE